MESGSRRPAVRKWKADHDDCECGVQFLVRAIPTSTVLYGQDEDEVERN